MPQHLAAECAIIKNKSVLISIRAWSFFLFLLLRFLFGLTFRFLHLPIPMPGPSRSGKEKEEEKKTRTEPKKKQKDKKEGREANTGNHASLSYSLICNETGRARRHGKGGRSLFSYSQKRAETEKTQARKSGSIFCWHIINMRGRQTDRTERTE